MTWWYENEEEEMKLYKNEDLCIECKNEFFSKPYDHRDPTPGQLGYCIKCDNCLIKDRKMEFDKSRCFTSLNADELKAGDKVIVANSLSYLRHCVECDECMDEIVSILSDDNQNRFLISGSRTFALAYLVERAENCTNCEYSNLHNNLLYCDDDKIPIIIGGEKLSVCSKYKPKTEQKAEPTYKWVNYRPFKDTDELIKVWEDKLHIAYMRTPFELPHIWVRYKDKHIPQKGTLIRTFFEEAVSVDEKYLSLETLTQDYEFLDGSPCGVEE